VTASDVGITAPVAHINALLRDRAGIGGDLRIPLALSYLLHIILGLTLLLVARHRSYQGFTSSTGILPVRPLYGFPDAGPAPRPEAPRAAVAPAAPPAARLRRTPSDRGIKEVKDRFQDRREHRPAAKSRPVDSSSPAATDQLLQPTVGTPGSPSGSLHGGPDGGLGTLMFANQWYVQRIQDIVYMNWGNPFAGRDRPAAALSVEVEFRILRDGTVVDTKLERSSGHPLWDRAALRAVEHSRLPPLPADYPGDSVRVLYTFAEDAAP